MIKISKHLYIHPLTVLLFIIGFITRQLEMFCVCYLIMLLHELAHLISALLIGLTPSKIIIYPFGLNLKLKNKIIYSLADEIILYASGPLLNIILAFISLIFMNKYNLSNLFYMQNISLFIINMLPVMPLDGGIITKKILCRHFGLKIAEKTMKVISSILIILLTLFCLYLVYLNNFSYSAVILIVFLLSNLFTSGEKYNIDFLKELLFYKEKGEKYNNRKIKILLMHEGENLKNIVSEFALSGYYIVYVLNKKGTISEVITETEIIEKITNIKGVHNF